MALKWEPVQSELVQPGLLSVAPKVMRAKVPGGWFISVRSYESSAFFYPDPEHRWDGSSLP